MPKTVQNRIFDKLHAIQHIANFRKKHPIGWEILIKKHDDDTIRLAEEIRELVISLTNYDKRAN